MKKSAILEAVHETAQGLHQAGVMDQVTLREFDRSCLPPVEPLEPEQIRQIREACRVSAVILQLGYSRLRLGISKQRYSLRIRKTGFYRWVN